MKKLICPICKKLFNKGDTYIKHKDKSCCNICSFGNRYIELVNVY